MADNADNIKKKDLAVARVFDAPVEMLYGGPGPIPSRRSSGGGQMALHQVRCSRSPKPAWSNASIRWQKA